MLNPRLFLSQAADRARLPVALLSGFLGSGKTTLINALLRDPRLAETAVAVNEFGDIPLDRDLIDHGEGGGDGRDSTVVLANGCLCCNLAGDMESAMMRLFARREAGEVPRFRRVIIEPSGLADPAPIAQAILRNPVMARAMRLDGIMATVDAVFAAAQIGKHAETRKQIALADRLLLTKTDLAEPDALARLRLTLRHLNGLAPIDDVAQGAIDPAAIFSPHFLDPTGADPQSETTLSGFIAEAVPADGASAHLDAVAAISLVSERPVEWRAFEAWLRGIRLGHAEQLLRLKGILGVQGSERPVVVHGIHHVLHAPVTLERWPSADRRCRLVMIADGATGAAIRQAWADALPALTN
jgi:G3E family GTPase